MKVENGKIIECTESELWDYWYSREWWQLYSFPTYMRLCENAGTKVTEKEDG